MENVFKVKLTEQATGTIRQSRRVVFDVTPDIVETRNINYRSLDPVHMPGQIFVYGNTSSRTFNISNVRLISRTSKEAANNLRRLQQLRYWAMPRFGLRSSTLNENQRAARLGRQAVQQSNVSAEDKAEQIAALQETVEGGFGGEILGAPPKVLYLSAYSRTPVTGTSETKSGLQLENIRRVPVVLQQISIPYPSDVDYIPTEPGPKSKSVPFPTIMTLDMVLLESHSPREYERFSLHEFKHGILKGF